MNELERRDDQLFGWAKERKASLVIDSLRDSEQVDAVREILASHAKLIKHSGRGTRSGADPWVIALARARQFAVVTLEERGSENRPKIPDVCQHYGVRCLTLVDFFRECGWKF